MAQAAMAEFSLKEVNWPKDASTMSDLQKKHSPRIECPDSVASGEIFDVRVMTGKLKEHPNELAHYIMWTELYAGERFLGRAEFAPKVTSPEACFKVSLAKGEDLVAYSMCNLHGQWKNSVPIEVR